MIFLIEDDIKRRLELKKRVGIATQAKDERKKRKDLFQADHGISWAVSFA